MELIYCAAGNSRFAKIALDAGYSYGAQLPGTVYFPLSFADQNWKKPDKEAYMLALSQHQPRMASVLDWERHEQLPEVLGWAEEAAAFTDSVMLIPKVPGGVDRLPRIIGGKPIRLGFSVPTRHGGTTVWAGEFHGWPVHLLGGSPQAQMKWYSRLSGVVSADGNYHQKMATRYCQFWQPGTATYAHNRWWPTLLEADGKKWGDGTSQADAPYEAFRRSCEAVVDAWKIVWGEAGVRP